MPVRSSRCILRHETRRQRLTPGSFLPPGPAETYGLADVRRGKGEVWRWAGRMQSCWECPFHSFETAPAHSSSWSFHSPFSGQLWFSFGQAEHACGSEWQVQVPSMKWSVSLLTRPPRHNQHCGPQLGSMSESHVRFMSDAKRDSDSGRVSWYPVPEEL